METFTQRLKSLCDDVGIDIYALSRLLGVSVSATESYMSGYSEPTIEVLGRIAQIFGISEAYAAMLTDDPSIEEDDSVKEIYVASELRDGGAIYKSDVVGTIYIKKEDMHGKNFYALLMPDNSMERARIKQGDILVVRRQSHADNGDIVVASVRRDVKVRRYERRNNIVLLRAESSRFDTIKIDTTEEEFAVLGKVDEVRIRNL